MAMSRKLLYEQVVMYAGGCVEGVFPAIRPQDIHGKEMSVWLSFVSFVFLLDNATLNSRQLLFLSYFFPASAVKLPSRLNR